MRVSLREAALLALPALSNAVSLADMTPRATGLPTQCEAVYTSQIYGCTATDFQTNQCSTDCINALYGISQAIYHVCGGQGITGQNLIVAFLDGVGPQQLCHNANDEGSFTASPTYTRGPPTTHWQPTIVSSTTTAHKVTEMSSLLVDTSSTMTQTIIPHHTKATTSSSSSQPPETTTKTKKTTMSTAAAEHTSPTHSPEAVSTTSSTTSNAQASVSDHSGGGSPFDTPGNMGAAASVTISMALTVLSAAAMLLTLR